MEDDLTNSMFDIALKAMFFIVALFVVAPRFSRRSLPLLRELRLWLHSPLSV